MRKLLQAVMCRLLYKHKTPLEISSPAPKGSSVARPEPPPAGVVVVSDTRATDWTGLQGRKVLLAGDVVFISLTSDNAPEDFISQAARDGVPSLKSLVSRDTPKVHLALAKKTFDVSRARFALAIDGYLAWGFAQRHAGTLIVLGSSTVAAGVAVDLLVFHGGVIQEVDEKILPHPDSGSFIDTLDYMLASLRSHYPTARICQAGPGKSWNSRNVEFIGDAPFKRLSYRPIYRASQRSHAYIAPGIISLAGVIGFSGLLGFGWHDYESAKDQYLQAISDASIKSAGGIDTGFLDIMSARRFFLERPRRQERLTQEAIQIVRGVGVVPDVQIVELKLPAPSIDGRTANPNVLVDPQQITKRRQIMPDRTPDVWVAISVPMMRDTAILQARDVMTVIANSTGMSLRLAHQGWRDVTIQGERRRQFNIEGFIHD